SGLGMLSLPSSRLVKAGLVQGGVGPLVLLAVGDGGQGGGAAVGELDLGKRVRQRPVVCGCRSAAVRLP
ncbi:hypothetical protein PV382_32200, partial [Streptomyces scabiei]